MGWNDGGRIIPLQTPTKTSRRATAFEAVDAKIPDLASALLPDMFAAVSVNPEGLLAFVDNIARTSPATVARSGFTNTSFAEETKQKKGTVNQRRFYDESR